MRTLKLTVAYDGTNYHGFQKQTNALTVQQVLEEKLSLLCGEKIVTAGSGRTDTGVHARGQVVSLTTSGICRRTISRTSLSAKKQSIAEERGGEKQEKYLWLSRL